MFMWKTKGSVSFLFCMYKIFHCQIYCKCLNWSNIDINLYDCYLPLQTVFVLPYTHIDFLSWCVTCICLISIIIPHATSCGGYNVFDQSVSQSVSPLGRFSCQHISSETIQQNFLKLCSYEGHYLKMRISTGNFVSIFFLGVSPFLHLEIWPKWDILLKQFVSATTLKPLNRITWNFVVVKDIPCRCAYLQEILFQFFFLGVLTFLNLEKVWPNWEILLLIHYVCPL